MVPKLNSEAPCDWQEEYLYQYWRQHGPPHPVRKWCQHIVPHRFIRTRLLYEHRHPSNSINIILVISNGTLGIFPFLTASSASDVHRAVYVVGSTLRKIGESVKLTIHFHPKPRSRMDAVFSLCSHKLSWHVLCRRKFYAIIDFSDIVHCPVFLFKATFRRLGSDFVLRERAYLIGPFSWGRTQNTAPEPSCWIKNRTMDNGQKVYNSVDIHRYESWNLTTKCSIYPGS
jgi:hypothetical protein